MDAAQWHTRMTYNCCRPNAVLAVTDMPTWICFGSKVTVPSVKRPHIHYNAFDMTSSLQRALIRLQAPCGNSPMVADDSEKTLHLPLNLSVPSADCFRGRKDDKSTFKEKRPSRAHLGWRAPQHMTSKSDVVCLFCWGFFFANRLDAFFRSIQFLVTVAFSCGHKWKLAVYVVLEKIIIPLRKTWNLL